MEWLFENPVANMPGPTFLGLFGAFIIGAIIILRMMAARIEQGEPSRPLSVPEKIDPYQIAYLRGGDTEVVRTAMVDLVEQGRLVEVARSGVGKLFTDSKIQWKAADPTDTGSNLSPIQRTLLRAFFIPRDPEVVFQSEIRSDVREHTRPFREWIDREELEVDPERSKQMRKMLIVLLVGIEALGLYKLASAIMHDRPNFIFLIGMMLFGLVVIPLCAQHRKLSKRGRDFLRDLQTAYGQLRLVKGAKETSTQVDYAFGNASMPLIAMGIFGVSALQGSEYDPLYRAYQRAAANGSGCSAVISSGCGSSGGGDSGTGCGSGSGCGGCGGGCGGGD